MIVANRPRSLQLTISADATQARATIELPADAAERASELYDDLFTFVFDVLNVPVIEVRVRAAERPGAERAAS
jgi:hypothetical protein